MFTVYNGLSVAITVLFSAASLLLLLERSPEGSRWRGAVSRLVRRFTGDSVISRITWLTIAATAAVGYATVVGFNLASGLYACHGTSGAADLVGMFHSGQAFWGGRNPFTVPDCGVSTIQVPYGIVAVLLNGFGSLGGLAGTSAIWGVVAVALVPLAWFAVADDRRYVVLLLALSPIYFPLVSGQIDGASNAITPVAVLVAVILGARSEQLGAIVGGFLATARFPSFFPILASTGSARRRFLTAFAAIASFGAFTLLTYLVWRSQFFDVVFLSQVNRRSFSLNAWGILYDHGWLPAGAAIPALQAVLTLAITAAAFFAARSALRPAAITLTGVALVTQFLSFNILAGLLIAGLIGHRPRWWLWAIATVGAINYDLALGVVAWTDGIYWPTELLDVVLTVLLLGLFVELWKGGRTAPAPSPCPSGTSAAGPGSL
ncbi:MAG TPA: hypothetical protein VK455_05665 [Thermoplasmata archaeon]|nr:hypothetical protein [Thermoplasmata archaeon]